MTDIKSLKLPGNGLTLNGLELDGDPAKTTVIVHGYLDQARSFMHLAQSLCADGYRRVLALDMRGHGDSDWAPVGSYYHFADYVGDLSVALNAYSPASPVTLIGHSMGGNLSSMFAGACPDRIAALVLAEGVGVMEQPPEVALLRIQRWIQQLNSPRTRKQKVIESMETAVEALTLNHGRVSKEILRRVAQECTRRHPTQDALTWVFDPLLQTMSPTRFDAKGFEELVRNISAPTLLIDGGVDGMTFDGIESRLSCYQHHHRVSIEGAGHMMHWTKPVEFAACISDFLLQNQR